VAVFFFPARRRLGAKPPAARVRRLVVQASPREHERASGYVCQGTACVREPEPVRPGDDASADAEPTGRPFEHDVGEQFTVKAQHELVLKVGAASITLKQNGDVEIKGESSRSKEQPRSTSRRPGSWPWPVPSSRAAEACGRCGLSALPLVFASQVPAFRIAAALPAHPLPLAACSSRWLCCRSQRCRLTWQRFGDLLKISVRTKHPPLDVGLLQPVEELAPWHETGSSDLLISAEAAARRSTLLVGACGDRTTSCRARVGILNRHRILLALGHDALAGPGTVDRSPCNATSTSSRLSRWRY
jgi:hypothetical protein